MDKFAGMPKKRKKRMPQSDNHIILQRYDIRGKKYDSLN